MRIELMFVESGSVVCLLAHSLGGLSPTEFMKSSENQTRLERQGFFISPELYQDDSFIIRVVLDDLTPQEESEWVARSKGRLNLIDGELIIASAYDWMGYRHWDTSLYPRMLLGKHGGVYETTTYIRIEPGLYKTELYSYLPNDLSDSWSYTAEEDEEDSTVDSITAFFEHTCPDEPLPDWLAGEEADTSYINFVLHLTPVDQAAFEALEVNDPNVDFGWDFRRPTICPRGIVTDTVFEDAETYDEDEDET